MSGHGPSGRSCPPCPCLTAGARDVGYNRRLQIEDAVEVVGDRHRLESWKEIAAYLKRSERTVRRWEENEGLPVHRLQHDKRGSVYAYSTELDAWRESRRRVLQTELPSDPQTVTVVRRNRWLLAIALAGIAVGAASVGAWWLTRQSGAAATPAYVPHPEADRLVRRVSFGNNAGRVQIQTGIRYLQDAIRIDPAYNPSFVKLMERMNISGR
jgi:hypothetical protein